MHFVRWLCLVKIGPRRVVLSPMKQRADECSGTLVRFLLSMQRCKTMKDAGLRRQRVDHGTASHLLSAVAYKRSRLQAQVTRAPGRVCALLGNIPQLRIASIKIFVMKHEFRPRCSPA